MKTLSKILFSLVSITMLFASCEQSIVDREPSPLIPEDCQGVYFPSTNKTVVELEPTAPTEFSLTISRTDSTEAIEVPLTVEINDSDVFVVPEKVSFAIGQKETTFSVSFPNAEEGITYNLKLSVSGDSLVNEYATTHPYLSTSLTRIKWNDTQEPFVYVDGTFLTFYGVSQLPMYVETQKATVGNSIRYRFKNAYKVSVPGSWNDDNSDYIPEADEDGIYNGYYYNWPGDFDETANYYTVIEVDEDGNVTMFPNDLGVVWSYGMFSIGSVYGYLSDDISSYPLGKLSDGVITFPSNSLYISMANYKDGKQYLCETPTYIYLNKSAYLAANMKIKDYNDVQYDEISGAVSEFSSKAYSESWNQTIEKAIDIDAENEESEYKNLYYLPDLYTADYGIAFYYNGKTVSIPENQPTGKNEYGKDVYVSQSDNVESSVVTNSKGVTVYTLGLKFHFEDGTMLGEFAETFYYSENAVSYSIDDFLGNFKLTGNSMFDSSTANMDVTIAAGATENENTFVISGIEYAEAVNATFDSENSTMSIIPQELADYGTYDMALYTYTADGNVSTTEALIFTFDMSGKLMLTANSGAVAYLIRSETAGGWIDGYSDLIFTPKSGSSAAKLIRPVTSAAKSIKPQTLKKVTNTALKTKCKKGNFEIRRNRLKEMIKNDLRGIPLSYGGYNMF